MAVRPSTKGTAPTSRPVSRTTATTTKTAARSKTAAKPRETDKQDETEVLQNLRLLKAILDAPVASTTLSAPAKRAPRFAQTTAASRGTKTATTTVARSIDGKSNATEEGPSSATEQKKLAMNSFNKSLKVLSAVVKKRQDNKRRETQLIATNTTELPAVEEEKDVSSHAECACAALGVLWQVENLEKSSSATSEQREQGAIILLEKLISLHMKDLAHTQASRTYDQYWKKRKDETSKKKPPYSKLSRTVMAELLVGDRHPESKTAFDMTCSFQSQVLRLAILAGTEALSSDFVRATSLETAGSPVDVVISGQQSGYLSKEKAGENLRTISQALSKLYAVNVQPIEKLSRLSVEISFSLLVEAQIIKVASWDLLEHKPDVEREIWVHFERGMKVVGRQDGRNDPSWFDIAKSAIERIQNCLRKHEHISELPFKLQESLLQLAQANCDTENAMQLLANLSLHASVKEKLFLLCQLATLQLSGAALNSATLETINEVLLRFSQANHADITISADQLLTVVRLRKACSQKLSAASNPHADAVEKDLLDKCLQLLFVVLHFCTSQASRDAHGDAKISRSVHLATLKTIEAIIDTEKYVVSATVHVFRTYITQLEHCLSVLTDSSPIQRQNELDDSSTAVLKSLKVRLSNVFWRAHIHPNMADTSLALAQKSIACLEDLSVEQSTKAALGPRLEKLGNLQISASSIQDAKQTLRKAIQHYVTSGALADAVEASLSKQSSKVWTDTGSLANQLARTVHAYNCLELGDGRLEVFSKCLYDDKALPEVHRAILLEFQVLSLLKKQPKSSVYEALIDTIKTIIDLTREPQYCIWRLRFAHVLTSRVSKARDLDDKTTSNLVELLAYMVDDGTEDSNVFLKQYASSLRTTLDLQQALLDTPILTDDLREKLSQLEQSTCNCTNRDDVDQLLDDSDIVVHMLKAYADRTVALGLYDIAALCLNIRLHLIRCGIVYLPSDRLNCLSQLLQCQTKLDRLDLAKNLLDEACTLAASCQDGDDDLINLHLASAEYYLASGVQDECRTSLELAGVRFIEQWAQGTNLSSAKQIERDGTMARAVLLASRIAFQGGNLTLAHRYARQAAKISVSIWTALTKRKSPRSLYPEEPSVGDLTKDLSKLNIASHVSLAAHRTIGAELWPYLDMYVHSLKHASSIHYHSGLFDDAMHYFKQLRHMSSSTPLSQFFLCPEPAMGLLLAKAGKIEAASETLAGVDKMLSSGKIQRSVEEMLTCAEAFLYIGNHDVALRLASQVPALPVELRKESNTIEEQTKPIKPATKARRGPAAARSITVPTRRRKSPIPELVTSESTRETQVNAHMHLTPAQLQVEDRRKALLSMLTNTKTNVSGTCSQGLNLALLCASPKNLVRELFAAARVIVAEAWERLCADSMQSVFTESAVALPSKHIGKGRNGRVSFLQGGEDRAKLSPSKWPLQSLSTQTENLHVVASMLQNALRLVTALMNDRLQYCSTDMLHTLVKMEARISLLLTTMNLPFTISSTELVLRASQPKDAALEREHAASKAEAAMQDRPSLSTWPTELLSAATTTISIQSNQLNELPKSWSIISLTLAEDEDELLLSKIVNGQSPFLIRIPLRRSNEGDSIDEFVFEDARSEIKDIIEHANFSSHDVRGAGDKATRSQWHADREALDKRLEMLLHNIESIWFGGFRGVLSPQVFSHSQVKGFGKALTQTLDNHLPSRRKSGITGDQVEIHDHVLETFVGLGDPDVTDLDDAIIDLLYFVVDILQFNGERNAYDEIDWDAMLVDILDALRVCHNSASDNRAQHTILIMDKELEVFPWESLPCLIDHPVSRMPSLGCVLDRLEQIRKQSPTADAYNINRSTMRGSYILNPSGDLTSTQTFFTPILSAGLTTDQYTPLIHSAPTEVQFSSFLRNSDVLLYFGHGSGAQYIRGRSIRSLPICAVTFLFGCSSAKMTEHGAFESTGMPRYYMLGHAPAVVGCLWDVTDKEIDRVALSTLVEWGVIDGETTGVQEGLKKKGTKSKNTKPRMKQLEDVRSKTLIQAVQKGREASVLRYLCGAAVVVHGIPVVLD